MPSRRQQTINETYTWSQVLRTKRTFTSFNMYMLQKPCTLNYVDTVSVLFVIMKCNASGVGNLSLFYKDIFCITSDTEHFTNRSKKSWGSISSMRCHYLDKNLTRLGEFWLKNSIRDTEKKNERVREKKRDFVLKFAKKFCPST